MKITTKQIKAPVSKDKYELVANINATEFKATGNDIEVFKKLEKPPKYVTKGLFTLTNKENGKSFQVAFPPFLTRKLMVNSFVQAVQWKRMSGKVA